MEGMDKTRTYKMQKKHIHQWVIKNNNNKKKRKTGNWFKKKKSTVKQGENEELFENVSLSQPRKVHWN